MGCLALFLNFLLPGLGTILFTNKKTQGFIQIVLSVINYILMVVTLGLWVLIGGFIQLGLFVWSIASTVSFMSEESAKKVMREERERQRESDR
jgi:hypothetical protein